MGILLLGPSRNDVQFGAMERQVLRNCADQFALMMENARLTDRVVGQEALRRDLALAAEVQKRLLPSGPPSANIAEFAAISMPARSIGGDYYDFIQVGDQQIGLALADVSGKGVAAALIMSVVQASLRIIASDGDISLPRLAARMNDFLYRTTPGNKYATFFYAQVDGDRRQLRYVNAGHNPPYLVRARANASGAPAPMEELTIGGAVVGMLPGMSYEEATVDLCLRRRAARLHGRRHRGAQPGQRRIRRGAIEGVAGRGRPPVGGRHPRAHLGRAEGLDQGRRTVRRPDVRGDESELIADNHATMIFRGYCELSSRKVFLFSRSFSVGCTSPFASVTRETTMCSPGAVPVHE